MKTRSPIHSVKTPGYVHPPGTEASFVFTDQGRAVELVVRDDDDKVMWTEQFLLPPKMKIDRTLPQIIMPQPLGIP